MKRLKLNMTREIQVLIVEPGKPLRAARVKNTEDAFAEIVGGPIARFLRLFVGDEQNQRGGSRCIPGFSPNRRIPLPGGSSGESGCICGTFLVCGVAENSYVS